MATGGCACGNIAFTYTGEPQMKALCHCGDCRKITGSTYSTNIVVDGSGVKVTKGTPKQWTKVADSGNSITSFFCGDCGSTLFRSGETFGPNYVIKVGVLDDPNALNDAQPGAELYVPERVKWVSGVQGTKEFDGMPS